MTHFCSIANARNVNMLLKSANNIRNVISTVTKTQVNCKPYANM